MVAAIRNLGRLGVITAVGAVGLFGLKSGVELAVRIVDLKWNGCWVKVVTSTPTHETLRVCSLWPYQWILETCSGEYRSVHSVFCLGTSMSPKLAVLKASLGICMGAYLAEWAFHRFMNFAFET